MAGRSTARPLLDGVRRPAEARIEALRTGYFDLATWTERQATTGRLVTLDDDPRPVPAPWASTPPRAALVVEDAGAPAGERIVHAGEIRRVRLGRRFRPGRGCNAMPRPVFGRREGATREASSRSTVTARSSRRLVGTPPSSTPCTGSTSPRCMPTPSTSSPTTTPRRTRRNACSCAPSPRCRGSASWPRPEDGRDASTFRVWLFRIARNVVANERRARRRRPAASLESALGAGLVVADPVDLEAGVALRDEAATALAALDRLPDDRRRALLLRFVDEMSTAEIAGVLGRSEGAVRVLIHRGLRAVAADLGRTRGRRR